jgi:hypothetical protein
MDLERCHNAHTAVSACSAGSSLTVFASTADGLLTTVPETALCVFGISLSNVDLRSILCIL